jgi:hypothetical protein
MEGALLASRIESGGAKMTTAYLLIKTKEEIRRNGLASQMEELLALPEVEAVQPVEGLYDCVAQVDTPMATIFVTHKVMKMGWVARVHLLRVNKQAPEVVESEQERAARLAKQREIIGRYWGHGRTSSDAPAERAA